MEYMERERLEQIIGRILDTITRETGIRRDFLGLEIEQVVTRGVFEAHRIALRSLQVRSSSTSLSVVKK